MRALERCWRPGGPVDVTGILGVHRRGGSDPAHRVTADGALWRTCRPAAGVATVQVFARPADGEVVGMAWGPGAGWVLDELPRWLGAEDDATGFRPEHPVLRRAQRVHTGLRVGRTGLVFEALLPAVLEQKITSREAWRGWRSLLRRFGEPAPGPAPDGMRVLPDPHRLAAIPSWEWHRMGVGPDHSRTVVQAARLASRLERLAELLPAEAGARLQSIPGIGPWTAAEVRQRALGDADAVSVGDYHLPQLVAYSLAGEERADDDRMLELLAPYAGHRYRACLLLERHGALPPRRGPRMPVRDFRAI